MTIHHEILEWRATSTKSESRLASESYGCQLRGEQAAGRCKAEGLKKPEAYSLQYVEDFLGPRTTQMPADRSPQ
jgi:hypothetical protein